MWPRRGFSHRITWGVVGREKKRATFQKLVTLKYKSATTPFLMELIKSWKKLLRWRGAFQAEAH